MSTAILIDNKIARRNDY